MLSCKGRVLKQAIDNIQKKADTKQCGSSENPPRPRGKIRRVCGRIKRAILFILRGTKTDGFFVTLKKLANIVFFFMSRVRLSVVIAVYNQEKYLDDCLSSIVAQNFGRLEIICVDDGSTDRSSDMLREWQRRDGRINVITQKNAGAGAARNNGLMHAKGRFILFLDSDDFFAPNMFSAMTKRALETNADITLCHSYQLDASSGDISYNRGAVNDEFLPRKDVFCYKDFPDKILNFCIGWAWDKLYKRKFVMKKELRFQPLRTTNDAFFVFTSLVKASAIAVEREALVTHRFNIPESLAATRELSWQCFYKALIAVRDELKKMGVFREVEQSYVNWAVNFTIWNYITLAEPVKSQLHDLLKNSYFAELGLLGRDASYFHNNNQYNKEFMDKIIASPIAVLSETE